MQTRTIYSIYCHTFNTSGKSYIGKSDDIQKRLKNHIREAYTPNHKLYNTHFKRAIRKYGVDDITTTILFQTPNEGTAYLAEVYFIAIFNTFLGEGYNGNAGGKGGLKGVKRPQEFKDATSKRQTGKNNSFYGKKHTPETINNISKKLVGENNPFFGKKHTDTSRRKISNKLTGKKYHLSEETKNKKAKICKDRAKQYLITFPDGHEQIITNLAEFAKKHELSRSGLSNVANGHRKSYKGYNCIKLISAPSSVQEC